MSKQKPKSYDIGNKVEVEGQNAKITHNINCKFINCVKSLVASMRAEKPKIIALSQINSSLVKIW